MLATSFSVLSSVAAELTCDILAFCFELSSSALFIFNPCFLCLGCFSSLLLPSRSFSFIFSFSDLSPASLSSTLFPFPFPLASASLSRSTLSFFRLLGEMRPREERALASLSTVVVPPRRASASVRLTAMGRETYSRIHPRARSREVGLEAAGKRHVESLECCGCHGLPGHLDNSPHISPCSQCGQSCRNDSR